MIEVIIQDNSYGMKGNNSDLLSLSVIIDIK